MRPAHQKNINHQKKIKYSIKDGKYETKKGKTNFLNHQVISLLKSIAKKQLTKYINQVMEALIEYFTVGHIVKCCPTITGSI